MPDSDHYTIVPPPDGDPNLPGPDATPKEWSEYRMGGETVAAVPGDGPEPEDVDE